MLYHSGSRVVQWQSVGRQTVIYALGPRARRVYAMLRDGLLSGEFAPGAKLDGSPLSFLLMDLDRFQASHECE